MRQIHPHALWLGHAGDGRDFRLLLDTGIQAVVQLAAEEPPLQLPRELTYCRFPLVDGPDNERKLLSLAVTTVANFVEENVPHAGLLRRWNEQVSGHRGRGAVDGVSGSA